MKVLLYAICILLQGISLAQKVVVKDAEENINGNAVKGVVTSIDLDVETVRQQWQRQLRTTGNLKTKNGVIYVQNATLKGVNETPLNITSKVTKTEKGSKIWFSVANGENQNITNKDGSSYAGISSFLHDFGVSAYIEDINLQIKEAEKVLSDLVIDHDKLLAAELKVKNTIYKNRESKTLMVSKIRAIDSVYVILRKDSVDKSQANALSNEDVLKMKKAVDLVKAKILQVE